MRVKTLIVSFICQNLDIPLIGNRMKSESKHPECALKHKWAGTELKLVNGK